MHTPKSNLNALEMNSERGAPCLLIQLHLKLNEQKGIVDIMANDNLDQIYWQLSKGGGQCAYKIFTLPKRGPMTSPETT